MSDATIARAARRFIHQRSVISELHQEIRRQAAGEVAMTRYLRDKAKAAAYAANDAFLDLLLAVRDEH